MVCGCLALLVTGPAAAQGAELPADASDHGLYLAISGQSDAGITTMVLRSAATASTPEPNTRPAWLQASDRQADAARPGWRSLNAARFEGPARALTVGPESVFVLMQSGRVWAMPSRADTSPPTGPRGQDGPEPRALPAFPASLQFASWSVHRGQPWAIAYGPPLAMPESRAADRDQLDARLLGLALDLPYGLFLEKQEEGEADSQAATDVEPADDALPAEPPVAAPGPAEPAAEGSATGDTESEPQPTDGGAPESAVPSEPASAPEPPAEPVRAPRLVTIDDGRWIESPLPAGLAYAEAEPTQASPAASTPRVLVMAGPQGVDRPALAVQVSAERVILWRPIAQSDPADAETDSDLATDPATGAEPNAEPREEPDSPTDSNSQDLQNDWVAIDVALDPPGRLIDAVRMGEEAMLLIADRSTLAEPDQGARPGFRVLGVRGQAVQEIARIDPLGPPVGVSAGDAGPAPAPFDPGTWRLAMGRQSEARLSVVAIGPTERPSAEDEAQSRSGPFAPARSPAVADAPPTRLWTVSIETGRVDGPAVIEPRPSQPLADQFGFVLLISTVGLALILMLVYWQREPELRTVTPPPGRKLADLPRRAAAGAADLLPGLLAASWLLDVPAGRALRDWPGFTERTALSDLLPAMVAIVAAVAWAGVFETALGRSPGKMLFRMDVRDLEGNRPVPWRLAVRNLLRIFDLTAPLLMLMPVISPARQRLGDMLAGTVVTAPANPTDPADPNQQNDADRPAPRDG